MGRTLSHVVVLALAASSALAFAPSWSRSSAPAAMSGSAWAGRSARVAPSAPRGVLPRMMSTVEDAEVMDADGGSGGDVESYPFEAEVSRVVDIIINSLYSDRDVFLRELVSNAADACDKRRFLSIGDDDRPSLAADDLRVRIRADKAARTLTIEDNGVGMTRDEMRNNLGRIAQSGTKKFMEALGSGDADLSLIGQFGVGFYSAYLVADKVSVTSCSMKEDGEREQLRWESQAGASYTIATDDSEPFDADAGGCGTRITLHLKEDCDE